MKNDRPNILIFMTDQEQAQVTWPNHPCRTPNIDRIAKQGVMFTHTYPPMAHCCPARASFMTGLYPSQHGVFNNINNDQAINSNVYPGVEMFSEKLKEAGYQLYYTGKWHVSVDENPQDRGWEMLENAPKEPKQVRNAATAPRKDYKLRPLRQGLGSRRELFVDLVLDQHRERKRGEIVRPGWPTFRLYGTSGRAYENSGDYGKVRRAVNKLEELRESNEPWCMFLGMLGPHDPFIIPEKYAVMYNPDDVQLPPNYSDNMADKPGIYKRMKKVFSQLTEQEVKESIAHYWGFCTMMDDMFGEVLDALERNGQMDNTLIIFLSDHGEHAGAHGIYCKGISQFDEGYRVPLVISHPTLVNNPGRSVDEFVTLMDIAPTLLELAGAAQLNKCSGASLTPFLRDEQPPTWRDCLYTQCNGTELYYVSRMVKTKKYKFVYNPTDMDELYDLEKDPYEMTNLADQPGMEEVKKQMYVKMWENAHRSDDNIFVKYITVSTAEYGPAIINETR